LVEEIEYDAKATLERVEYSQGKLKNPAWTKYT
jgi:hypothetical protein